MAPKKSSQILEMSDGSDDNNGNNDNEEPEESEESADTLQGTGRVRRGLMQSEAEQQTPYKGQGE